MKNIREDVSQSPAPDCSCQKYAYPFGVKCGHCITQKDAAPDLDKIVERLEGMKKPTIQFAVSERWLQGFNAAIDAALELIKQARG